MKKTVNKNSNDLKNYFKEEMNLLKQNLIFELKNLFFENKLEIFEIKKYIEQINKKLGENFKSNYEKYNTNTTNDTTVCPKEINISYINENNNYNPKENNKSSQIESNNSVEYESNLESEFIMEKSTNELTINKNDLINLENKASKIKIKITIKNSGKIKWPAEFLRINKHVNKLSIVNEIKSEAKTLYEGLYIL